MTRDDKGFAPLHTYEQAFIAGVTFTPIPSLWGHTAGAASNPADREFLNDRIGKFLERLELPSR